MNLSLMLEGHNSSGDFEALGIRPPGLPSMYPEEALHFWTPDHNETGRKTFVLFHYYPLHSHLLHFAAAQWLEHPKRAIGVTLKPNVNTVQVKGVAAIGQNLDHVLFLKLTQTHHASIHAHYIIIITYFQFLCSEELECGYVSNDGFVKAAISIPGGGGESYEGILGV
ncbi:RING-H2 finger protein ATL1 [Senna tora]|uniref:RING-H2 finger protein ATL1 n=1 Tax=Senna tora TaxID=362788 RepID=A0A834W589_9FABA|nr:RING-H2 finger protein ATL1 [Senna tora]